MGGMAAAPFPGKCFLLLQQVPKPSAALAAAHPLLLGRRRLAALPETAAACVAAAGLVGVAASLLVGRAAEGARREEEEEEEECSECGGTGLCPRCKGEGFVFKQLPEEAASRARKAAKNMATRYTSGLPTKWTYCNRCSSTRSCTTCGGSGAIPKASSPTTTTL
ncbi:uncharacterized protein LOC127777103 [Oryza glaberrima]|uniref:DUF7895 domain-containing protein n=1 Tax=Oryza glaberrima TaxID=4538 RepID=I1Q6X9_ORYGL|nr:uncharacterized protein LOC127777103 [Oryza glaberrima]